MIGSNSLTNLWYATSTLFKSTFEKIFFSMKFAYGLSSISTDFLPSNKDAIPVDPLPAKLSSTTSPSLEYKRMNF